MAKKWRVAVIGCGRMGSTIDDEVQTYPAVLLPYSHAAAYAEMPEVELVAAADVNPAAREAFARRWGVARMYEDYRELLEKEHIDLVSVTTRATERAAVVMDALRAGVRGIFAEKAISATLAEGDAIVRLAEEKRAVVAVNCSRRWHPFFAKAREMIEAGDIGTVRFAYGSCGGGLSHSGSHLIDILRFLVGSDVSWVQGHCKPDQAAGEEDLPGNAYMFFANGATGVYHGLSSPDFEVQIIGSRGRINGYHNGLDWEWWTYDGAGRPAAVRRVFPRPTRIVSPTITAIRDILHCIEHGGTPRCSAVDGRAALEVAIAIRESERQGGTRVQLPLVDRGLGIISR